MPRKRRRRSHTGEGQDKDTGGRPVETSAASPGEAKTQRPQTPRRQPAGQRSEAQGQRSEASGAGGQQRAHRPGPEGGRQQRPQQPRQHGSGERPPKARFPQSPPRPQGQAPAKPAPQPQQQRPPEPGPRTRHQQVPQALKSSIELASELAKKELAFRGKIGSMAVFVYPESGAGPEKESDQGGTVKTVALSNRNELQKEAVRKRIREKVAAESISTVILMTDGKKERTGRASNHQTTITGSVVLTGVMPSAGASASVAYSLDKGTKTFTVWDFRWLDSFVDDYFLQNVFGKGDDTPGAPGSRHRRNG